MRTAVSEAGAGSLGVVVHVEMACMLGQGTLG